MSATFGTFLFTSVHAVVCVSVTGTIYFTVQTKTSIRDESPPPSGILVAHLGLLLQN